VTDTPAGSAMSHRSQQRVFDLYRDVHREMRGRHGLTVRALWGSEASQRARFRAFLPLFGSRQGWSVLDLGSGLADFYPFLAESGFSEIEYCGTDIDPDFVAEARRRHPEATFVTGSVDEVLATDRSFDYVVASGIYNLAGSAREAERHFLRQFLALAPRIRVGFAVNFLSRHSQKPDGVSAYHDPLAVLGLCLRRFGPRVRLDHTYLPHDFTIAVYL
jgi:SAM-dependent methyltransferase